MLEICGGQAGPIDDQIVNLPERREVSLRVARAAKVIGMPVAQDDCAGVMRRLGLPCREEPGLLHVTPPSWRFDLSIEVDLIEELARVYGYNQLPVRSIRADLPLPSRPEGRLSNAALRRTLVARGYQEAITYSFVDPKLQALLAP